MAKHLPNDCPTSPLIIDFFNRLKFPELNNVPDESTCCDDDFTWVCNAKENAREPRSLQYSFTSLPNAVANSGGHANTANETHSLKSSKLVTRQGSLDRRRFQNRNRQERDSKSRSAHSLQDSSPSTDFAEPAASKGHQTHHKNSSSASSKYSHHAHQHHRSKVPSIFWERPYFPHWDPNLSHCANYYGGSREDVRLMEYHGGSHHRRHHDYSRCDSDGMLNMVVKKQRSPVINGSNSGPANGAFPKFHMHGDDTTCCNRYYSKPMPSKSCCACEYVNTSSPPPLQWSKRSQVRNAFSRSFVMLKRF